MNEKKLTSGTTVYFVAKCSYSPPWLNRAHAFMFLKCLNESINMKIGFNNGWINYEST
jgi:hypothetical protein